MGGSQSAPRSVTIENPDVIKITENVVDRLQKSSEQTTFSAPERHPLSSSDTDVSSNSNVTYITSQQIRREVNDQLDQNNAYWENRLKVLRNGYRKINADLEEEHNKAVREVNQTLGKHFTSSGKDAVQSCQESKKNVVECYSLNKNKPLQCSEQVQKFNDCVASGMSMMLKSA